MFTTYTVVDGEHYYMGNFDTSKVEGKGIAVLNMRSNKELIYMDVLHVPEISLESDSRFGVELERLQECNVLP